jgi:hypothetical protein
MNQTSDHRHGEARIEMFAGRFLSMICAVVVAVYLAPASAAEQTAEEQVSSLPIVRVIPGHHRVTVEWVRPKTTVEESDLHYRVAVKFRTATWEEARIVTMGGAETSATVRGLLNNTDYAVRVVAEQISTGKRVAESPERLVTPGAIPGIVIDYLHKDDRAYAGKGQYIGSPSIARLEDGRLVVSHDLFGGGGSEDFTRIFQSEDAGRTWRHAADVDKAFWGKLFVHKGQLYLLACSRQNGDLVLHHSPDGGESWGDPIVLASRSYHKAPVPILVHRGRLWTCLERQTGGWPAGFQAVVLSVPVDADLLSAENWTVSEPLPYDRAWLPKEWSLPKDRQGFLEGNVVMDPRGNLLNILRYHLSPHFGKAIILDILPDGKSLSFNRVIDFPGGMTKFTIRRQPETGVYWSLVNRVTNPEKPAMRSVLTLVCSTDLDRWTLVRDVLRDDRETAPQYTGFQYVDWLFDGNDIIFVSRTAYNGAHNYHDANHLTFHRIRDFAQQPPSVGP